MKYQYSTLENSQWVERQIIQSKNRKKAIEVLRTDTRNKMTSGCFKLRKLSD
jgi:hypothetical protein